MKTELDNKLSQMTQTELVDAYIKTLNWQHKDQQRLLTEIRKYLTPYYEAFITFSFEVPDFLKHH